MVVPTFELAFLIFVFDDKYAIEMMACINSHEETEGKLSFLENGVVSQTKELVWTQEHMWRQPKRAL